MDISVVIPLYNEAESLPELFAWIQRVMEENHFTYEGTSRYYLNINGVWQDHIHMVKINYAMHVND